MRRHAGSARWSSPTCTSTSAARWRRTSCGPSRTTRASSCRCRRTGSFATWSRPRPTPSLARRLPGDPAPVDREDSVVAGRHRAVDLRDHRQGVPLEHVSLIELRFNPMKRNLGGERDLDHIIHAALRGMDRACLEYGVRAGLIFCLAREFPLALNEILVKKAVKYRSRGVIGIDLAGPETHTLELGGESRRLPRAVRARARRRARHHRAHRRDRAHLGGGRAGGAREADAGAHRSRRRRGAPARRRCASWRRPARVLEICPSSNLRTHAVAGSGRARARAANVRRARACGSRSTPTGRTC